MSPVRRTYKIVRSEIALASEFPTINDGACTIVSLPRPRQLPTSSSRSRHVFAIDERPCIAWLDWRGFQAKFYCVYNYTDNRYSHFILDRRSVDPPTARFDAKIRFSNHREPFVMATSNCGWESRRVKEVRDENGELFMVIDIRVDDGAIRRCGKAYGKLMRADSPEEDVVMTLEEGLDLGCRMELETMEEERMRLQERMELQRLEGELVMVRSVLEKYV